MTLDLYQCVSLRRDFEEHHLKAGDVAMLIDRVPHPSGGEGGVILEVFNALWEVLDAVIVPESAIEPLRGDEILTVRSLADAS